MEGGRGFLKTCSTGVFSGSNVSLIHCVSVFLYAKVGESGVRLPQRRESRG